MGLNANYKPTGLSQSLRLCQWLCQLSLMSFWCAKSLWAKKTPPSLVHQIRLGSLQDYRGCHVQEGFSGWRRFMWMIDNVLHDCWILICFSCLVIELNVLIDKTMKHLLRQILLGSLQANLVEHCIDMVNIKQNKSLFLVLATSWSDGKNVSLSAEGRGFKSWI